MKKIEMIAVADIYPHPQNPRKELGDLSELTESIKQNGIFQNLTVVPRDGGGYTAIIGHRRLAAAKEAGLSEVPCAIVEMSEQEQLETMLVENMQRSDLTVYEQAEGFQLLLDFGNSIEKIAKNSGFSESTVRRRVKLLELDKGKFKAASDKGATLDDFAKLDKIKDPERKNKVLESIGTSDFEYAISRAIQEEKSEERINKFCEQAAAFAQPISSEDVGNYQWCGSHYCWEQSDIEVPSDSDSVNYYYCRNNTSITIYKDKVEVDTSDEEAESIAKEERKALWEARSEEVKGALNTVVKEHLDFVKELATTPDKIDIPSLGEFVSSLMINRYLWYNDPNEEVLSYLYDVNVNEFDDLDDNDIYDTITHDNDGVSNLLRAAACVIEDECERLYSETYNSDLRVFVVEFEEAGQYLRKWRQLLIDHGYIPSELEEALFGGKYAEYAGWEDIK